jgi:hypothetical protein
MAITIPSDYLETGPDPITVTTNPNAKYDITAIINDTDDFGAFATAVNSGDTAQKATFGTAGIIIPTDASYIPIGNASTPYTGVFNGLGGTVSYNLTGSTAFLGLFAYNNGTIQNLTVAGSLSVDTSRDIDYIGGVVAYNDIAGTISNVISNVVVTVGTDSVNNVHNVGGIAGFNGWDQYNTDSPHYGGRYQTGGYIFQCRNMGVVTGGFNKIGGIVGENAWIVDQCSNYGTITCAKTSAGWVGIGGIVGRNGNNDTATEQGTISNSYNRGVILDETTERTSHDAYGGITGWCNDTSIVLNSYDTGDFDWTTPPTEPEKNPVIGRVDDISVNNNNYSLDSVWAQDGTSSVLSGTRLSAGYMITQDFVDDLNQSTTNGPYILVSGGNYPNLKWEGSSPLAAW